MTLPKLELVDLDQLSRQELIEHINKQNDHIIQLKNLIKNGTKVVHKTREFPRKLDFSKYEKKHVILKFLYLGWKYDGLVTQDNSTNTVEDHLFKALCETRLIESRQTSNYHRCGRTDKGVSAFSQVISLDLRSKRSATGDEEIKYCKILNKVLPRDIRCICSAEVDQEFSARFDCKSRTYKYFFVIGTLDLEAMRKAGKYLEGEHNFQNFCKLDKTKLETNYLRSVESVKIVRFQSGYEPNRDIYELAIRSKAFLWHQIRCIVAVLFCVGERKEEPELVVEMLDPTKFSKKPAYSLAHELPLVLFDCEFEISNWQYDEVAIRDAVASLNDCFIESSIKNAISSSMLQALKQVKTIDNRFQKYFVEDLNTLNYKKFKDRPQSDMQLNEEQKTKLEKKLRQRSDKQESASKKMKMDVEVPCNEVQKNEFTCRKVKN